jgi:hypothetical protein
MGFARILNVIIIPLAVIIGGLYLSWKRRQRAAKEPAADPKAAGNKERS